MTNHTDKTVPYRLTQAELENLRLLRKKMNPSSSIPNDEEERLIRETDAPAANPDRSDEKTDQKTA